MKRRISRLLRRLSLLFTVSREDAEQFWDMRGSRSRAQRQPSWPMAAVRELLPPHVAYTSAVVYGAQGTVVYLADHGVRVEYIESDPGRAFGAEMKLPGVESGLLTVRVFDRATSEGRQEYLDAYKTTSVAPQLVVAGGRSRSALTASVCQEASSGTRFIVSSGGSRKYTRLREQLLASGYQFRVIKGPAADGSRRRASVLVIDL